MRHLTTAMALALLAAAPAAYAAEPVPVGPPNVPAQEPAFPEQTRAPQSDSQVSLATETIVDGLVHPWGVTVLPDGQMLVTERPGRLRVVSQDGELSEPIAGLPEIYNRDQGGLLDVKLDPAFDANRMIYWSYAQPREGRSNATAVARGVLNEELTEVSEVEVIFEQQPAWVSGKHFGSRLVWDNEGRLYITTGERSLLEPRKLAQDITTHLGKVIRVNADGSVPEGNPFVGDQRGLDEIWSYGHRNIQGAALNPETGELWTVAHGPQGGDEINQPQAGENYGWPVITYGQNYNGTPVGEGITEKDGMEQPIYYWDPVIAPSGMIFYTGDMFPEWQGDLLIGGLAAQAIVRIELQDKRVVGEERLLEGIGRVRDVVQAPDGSLLVLIDARNGELIRISAQTS